MARKVSGGAAKKKPNVELVANAAAYSIREFCAAHRISEAMYYKLRGKRLGPREARALTKVIITQEAAADWRREREASSADDHASAHTDAA